MDETQLGHRSPVVALDPQRQRHIAGMETVALPDGLFLLPPSGTHSDPALAKADVWLACWIGGLLLVLGFLALLSIVSAGG